MHSFLYKLDVERCCVALAPEPKATPHCQHRRRLASSQLLEIAVICRISTVKIGCGCFDGRDGLDPLGRAWVNGCFIGCITIDHLQTLDHNPSRSRVLLAVNA